MSPRLRRTALLAAAGALVPLLAACSHGAPAAETASAPPPTSSPAWTLPLDDEPEHTPAVPVSDPASVAAAQQRAVEAFTLYLRPEVDQRTWLRDLTPYLTPDAYEAYATVDPRRIEAAEIHADQAALLGRPTLYAVVIAVPTSKGSWSVSLSRTGEHDPWYVARFAPPAA
ncbi:MAG: hypothetical protein Q4E05_03400 [Pseudoclavibacter sp.]|nr:hypothetical protein [Pseudoclavibacter sp.]